MCQHFAMGIHQLSEASEQPSIADTPILPIEQARKQDLGQLLVDIYIVCCLVLCVILARLWCPDVCSNISLDVVMKVFLDEINT